VKLSDFLEKNGEGLLNFIMQVMGFVLENLKTIVSLIVAFKVMSQFQSMMTQYAIYDANTIANFGLGKLWAGIKVGLMQAAVSALVGATAGAATYGAMSAYGFADGGYVDAIPGGQVVRVAEGGEGEYIIPEHLMSDVIAGGEPALRLMTEGASASAVYGSPSSSSGSGTGASIKGGDTVINYYINGYTDSELRSIIRDTVNEITSDSRVKGRYW
jgi:hypothetical protein